MSFKVLHSSKIDKEKWNRCVSKYQMDIYNEYHFLNAVCLDNWYGFVWGDYEKILPFYRKKKWGIIPYICMPPFCQKFDNRNLTVDEWNAVLQYLKYSNLRINYCVQDDKMTNYISAKSNYEIVKTEPSISELREKYSTLVKKNLKKFPHKVLVNKNIDNAVEFLISNEEFYKIHYDKFALQFNSLIKSPNIVKNFFSVEIEGNLEGVIACLVFNHKIYLVFPHSTFKGRSENVITSIIDFIINSPIYTIIDFEGSSVPSISNFYRQFGSIESKYFHFAIR